MNNDFTRWWHDHTARDGGLFRAIAGMAWDGAASKERETLAQLVGYIRSERCGPGNPSDEDRGFVTACDLILDAINQRTEER